MAFSVAESLRDIREEIQRLQKLEQALVEASGEEPQPAQPVQAVRRTRVSPLGTKVISLAAQLRWLRVRKPPDRAAIAAIEKEIAPLRMQLLEEKKLARRRV